MTSFQSNTNIYVYVWLSVVFVLSSLVRFFRFSGMVSSFSGAKVHTQPQGWVTATDSKLGCPTESLHGNRELRSDPATAGAVGGAAPTTEPKEYIKCEAAQQRRRQQLLGLVGHKD